MAPQSSKGATNGADFAALKMGSASAGDLAAAEPPYQLLGRFWKPRFWPAWCLWLWMRFSASLPLPWALYLHRGIGRVLFWLAAKRRRIVRRNLELCFPELSRDELDRLCRRHFEALGASFAECAAAWLAADRRLQDRFRVIGIEHLRRALQRGNGVILYTGHSTALEICGRAFKKITPRFACMFSRRSSKLLDEIQRRGRARSAHELIPSDRVRSMLKSLKRNAVVWYAPDRAHGGRNAALIPFFGEPAMTSVTTSKIARLSGATVIPFSYRRVDREARYELRFHPPPEEFPSDDPVEDARRLVHLLEGFIRACPEQYLWVHRRFKGRPPELLGAYRSEREVPLPVPATRAAAGETDARNGGNAVPTLKPHVTDRSVPGEIHDDRHNANEDWGEAARPRPGACELPESPFSVVIPFNSEEPNVRLRRTPRRVRRPWEI